MSIEFKVGDKVILGTLKEIKKRDKHPDLVNEMYPYLGKTVTIAEIDDDGFRIEEDKEYWTYYPNWITVNLSKPENPFKPGIPFKISNEFQIYLLDSFEESIVTLEEDEALSVLVSNPNYNIYSWDHISFCFYYKTLGLIKEKTFPKLEDRRLETLVKPEDL